MPPLDNRSVAGSSPASNDFDWAKIFDIASATFERARLLHHPDTRKRFDCTRELMQMAAGLREYALAGPEDVVQAWMTLRKDTAAIDILLETMSEILLLTNYPLDKMAEAYARKVHEVVPVWTQQQPLATDPAFQESLGTATELKDLLTRNPWLFTILLLRRSGKLSLLRRIEEAAASMPAPENRENGNAASDQN
jgi:hypothetical protein